MIHDAAPGETAPASAADYDVAIIGGALSGAGTAIILLRENPALRVLIIERSPAFERRVGESTIEISTYFLTRVLGLDKHLSENHYCKQGLRYWYANEHTANLDDCSEIGGQYLSSIPAFMVDRAVLDEEALQRAIALGAECRRPAKLVKIDLHPGTQQVLRLRDAAGEETTVRARWAIDASGVAATLSRQEGWYRRNDAHPTTAVWSRWTDVKNWDGPELREKFPEYGARCSGLRQMATNHLVGDGWWCWFIPLKGGDTSVGLVFDQRLCSLPPGANLGERLRAFLLDRHPVARELLTDAHYQSDDVNYRKNLPYFSTTYAGDGFALVGDASAFIDPFYSPGLDWISYTATAAAELVLAERRGETDLPKRIELVNRDFVRGYERWFEAIYRDKYEYMGEFDLMRVAFLLDLGLYYIFVASQPHRLGEKSLARPIYSLPPSTPFFYLMRSYNRRMAAIARTRRARGELGRRSNKHYAMLNGYTFSILSARPILQAFASWLKLEITEGWRTWLPSRGPQPAAMSPEPVRAA